MNQPPPLEGYDLYGENRPLVEAVAREGGAWGEERLRGFGTWLGGEPLEWGAAANRNPPVLRTHDRFGDRIDEVDFHPAWHALLGAGVEQGVHALPWREPVPGAHAVRAALFHTLSQVEAGVLCPLSMTHASIAALDAEPDVLNEWRPRLTSLAYAPGPRPPDEKAGALCGMAMTERQGGSDVRTNTTEARPLADGEATLHGAKWFCSAPMSDAFLVLAQAPGGLTCYLVPRVLPDGTRNAFHIDRLKDKLGNRSNASAEIRLEGAWARRVGDEGRGVPTIVEMVNLTRFDCVLGSAALMRRAVAEATHHAAHRSAFGRRLAEHELMQNVLADLCVESEAATALALRLARALDEGDGALARAGIAAAKYWVCKSTPAQVAEALECLGGNGYVEESVLPRLHRESPLNSIWEGAGNVNALDLLRAVERSPESVDAVLHELDLARGAEPAFDAAVARLHSELADAADLALRARRLVELLATCLAASVLIRAGDETGVATAFCVSRLGGDTGRAYGTLPRGLAFEAIVERNRPRLEGQSEARTTPAATSSSISASP
jgi:putative acyl-CoA dehydrogenase